LDQIEVKPQLLERPEGEGAKYVPHFRGPNGVDATEESEQVGQNLRQRGGHRVAVSPLSNTVRKAALN
jgi:hypothetical protein